MSTKNRALIIGDLHISDRYTGKHKNYLENCIDVLTMITDEIKKNNITHLFLLGDLVGIHEKNLRYRDTLLYVLQLFRVWNELTNNNVYSLRGNHDIGSKLTDFELLTALGYIKTPKELVLGKAKFHLFDFGEERRQINIDDDCYNIALMHNNIQISGLTTWFRGGEGIELSSLENLYGVALVIAGHIHNPSIKMVSTSIKDFEVYLVYPGCPTRPKFEHNLWEHCYGVIIESDDEQVSFEQITFNLKPVEEVFTKTYDEIEDFEEDEEYIIDIEELSSILEELQTFNLSGGFDYKSQIRTLAGIDKEAADLALKYIEKVEEEIE